MKDLTGNNELSALCADWLEAKKQLAKWRAVESDAKIKIINACNKNQSDELIVGNFEVTKTYNKGSEGTEITVDDLGKIVGKRKPSESIKINEIKR